MKLISAAILQCDRCDIAIVVGVGRHPITDSAVLHFLPAPDEARWHTDGTAFVCPSCHQKLTATAEEKR